MKFGISLLPDSDPNTKLPGNYYNEIIDYAVLAEQLGFDYIKMTEHYLHPYGGYCPDPLIYFATIAKLTKKIRLMTGCLLPVFHHPIQLASRISMLDHICEGRLDIGFARAYMPYEFAALGVEMDGSREKFSDTVEAILHLWTKQNVSTKSKYFNFENVNILPGLHQKPHPPIWGAAVNSRQSFSWLAEQGFGLLVTPPIQSPDHFLDKIQLYREEFVGRSNGIINKPSIAISIPIIIHEDHQTAIDISEIYCGNYMRTWSSAAKAWQQKKSTDYPAYTDLAKILEKISPSMMREQGIALVGDPEFIKNSIQELYEKTKIDNFLWQIDFGQQPKQVAEKSLKLFAEKVRPYFS